MHANEGVNNDFGDYKNLSIAERIQLVEDIWDSIEADNPDSLYLSENQKKELHRRMKAHQADPSSGTPWESVRKKLFQHRST